MRLSSQVCYAFGGAAALAILAGCSSAGSPASLTLSSSGSGPSGTQSFARHAALMTTAAVPPSLRSKAQATAISPQITKPAPPIPTCPAAPVGFISDALNNVVYELNSSGGVCGTFTPVTTPGLATPHGLATDNSGHLYIANTGNQDVLEVNEATGAVVATYADAGEDAWDVCVVDSGPNAGDLAVTNIAGPGPVISLYTATDVAPAPPSGTASAIGYTSARFCAYDKQRTAFAFDDYEPPTQVAYVVPGNYSGPKLIHPLTTSNAIVLPGGVQFTTKNQPVIDDQSSSPPSLFTYAVSGTHLTLTAVTKMSNSGDPVSFAFVPGSQRFLTADAALLAAQLYPYPAGGPGVTFTIPGASMPIGAAINPSEQFARVH